MKKEQFLNVHMSLIGLGMKTKALDIDGFVLAFEKAQANPEIEKASQELARKAADAMKQLALVAISLRNAFDILMATQTQVSESARKLMPNEPTE